MGGRYLQNLKYYFRDAQLEQAPADLPRADSPQLGEVKKIAVLRANALGDFIFALPALEALKSRFPDAELVLLATAWHRKFLTGRPGPVDRVIVVPECEGIPQQSNRVENPAEVEDFFNGLRDESFDIAIQMHGGGRYSNPFVRNIGARLAIGLQDRDAIPLDINVPYCRYQNEVLRYLEIVKMLGAIPQRIEPRVTVTSADLEELDTGRSLKFPYAVIHPGASDRRRRWSPARFAQVGDALAKTGLHIYICGSEDESTVTGRVQGLMRAAAENLCGRLSINAYAALLSGAEILIANDTGPLHLARAVGTPTVGIYWIVNLVTSNAISVEKNRNCIAWNVFCPLCGADGARTGLKPAGGCVHDTSFVDEVTVEEVMSGVCSLLRTGARP